MDKFKDNLNKVQIEPKVFFTIALISYLLVLIFDIYNFVITLPLMNFLGILASLGHIVFDLALLAFFNYLRNNSTGMQGVSQEEDPLDWEKVIKTLENKNKGKNGKRTKRNKR